MLHVILAMQLVMPEMPMLECEPALHKSHFSAILMMIFEIPDFTLGNKCEGYAARAGRAMRTKKLGKQGIRQM